MSQSSTVKLLSEIGTNVLLFLLIFGMSATVNSENLRRQLGNKHAILIGVGMQFVIMPCLGFLAVYFLQPYGLTTAMGISLLIVTSSPGGSYSNWWCSLFNAELALSVAMTALSTIFSVAFLPANLLLYTWLAYGIDEDENILESISFTKIFVSITTVIVAIVSGLYTSYRIHSKVFRKWANRLGSISGILLIIFSAVFGSTQDQESRPWTQPWAFYVATVTPCLIGLALSNIIASRVARLEKPEVVTLSVECCYQNVGIATSAAVSIFHTPAEISQALAVPLLYGLVEAVVLGGYCMIAWKLGWTKAPKDESFCTVLLTTYEVDEDDESEEDILDAMCVEKNQCGEYEEGTVEVVNMAGVDTILEDPLEEDRDYNEYDSNTWAHSSDIIPKRKDTDSTADMSISEITAENESNSSNDQCHTFGESDIRSSTSDQLCLDNNEYSIRTPSHSHHSTMNRVPLSTPGFGLETRQSNVSSLPPLFRIAREVSSDTVEDYVAESQRQQE